MIDKLIAYMTFAFQTGTTTLLGTIHLSRLQTQNQLVHMQDVSTMSSAHAFSKRFLAFSVTKFGLNSSSSLLLNKVICKLLGRMDHTWGVQVKQLTKMYCLLFLLPHPQAQTSWAKLVKTLP